jgi:inner membrane protein
VSDPRHVRVREVVGAVAAIGGLDAVISARRWPVPVLAALDWPAHVATAALVLLAAPRPPVGRAAGWALVGSVAIDLDHVPLYLGLDPVAGPNQRPLSHSLTTSALLLGGSRLARGRARTALSGLATGTLLHFVRDIGTGPGVPLFWPLSRRNLRIPYPTYLAPVAAAALARAVAGRTGRRSVSTGPVA